VAGSPRSLTRAAGQTLYRLMRHRLGALRFTKPRSDANGKPVNGAPDAAGLAESEGLVRHTLGAPRPWGAHWKVCKAFRFAEER